MSTEHEEDLPPAAVEIGELRWEREEPDKNTYQWVRPLEDAELDWNPDADGVDLVGTEVPIRVVTLQKMGEEWSVEAAETAGPNYHRPGFTEVISSEYSFSTEDFGEAVTRTREFIQRLS